MKSENTKFHLLYGVMISFFLFIIIFLCCTNKTEALSESLSSGSVSFDSGWLTADGNETDISKLHKIEGIPTGQEFSIINTLPKEIGSNNSLFFRSKNIFYSVYVDDELIYDPEVPESIFYTNSFGTRWSIIELKPEYSGKTIEIKIIKSYDTARASIDDIMIGDPAGLVLSVIKEKIVALVTCILLIFVGVLLIAADFPVNFQKKKNHELLYLGFFSLSIATWCFSETNLVQFFDGDSRMMQIVSCYSLMLIPIPAVLYIDSAFGFVPKWLKPTVCTMSGINFLSCMILHFTGIADLRQTLMITHIMLGISAAFFLYTVIKDSILKKQDSKKVYSILRGIGLTGISVATIIDLIRHYVNNGTDSAMFVRIGLLIFVICYGSSSLENTINAVKLGVRSEFISKLAYQDGLTGVGNRTAFEERLAEFDKTKENVSGVGIVMFDLNDLKFINDNLGHQYGDSIIYQSADIIEKAFAPENGECFRIGGDEFAVLLSGSDIRQKYENGLSNFNNAVEQHNNAPENGLRISIAYGFEIYDKSVHKKMMDIYKRADAKMYETKKAMKAAQSRPEEYYKEFLLKTV